MYLGEVTGYAVVKKKKKKSWKSKIHHNQYSGEDSFRYQYIDRFR